MHGDNLMLYQNAMAPFSSRLSKVFEEQRTNVMALRSERRLPTRKGCKSDPKDPANNSDQFCNRIGCSGRIKNSSQNMKTGGLNKAACSKPSFNSSTGNGVVANSPTSNKLSRSNLDNRKELASELELHPSGAQKLVSPPSRSSTRNLSASLNKSREAAMAENGSVPSEVTSGKKSRDKLGSNSRNAQPTHSVSCMSKSSGMGTLERSNKTKYCQRNLKCNSISDVDPPLCSSTKSESSGRNDVRKRNPEGDSGSDRRVRRSNAAASVQKNVCTLKRKVSSQNIGFASSSRVPDSETRIDAARTSSSQCCSRNVAGSQYTTVSSPSGEPRLTHRNVGSQQRTNDYSIAELLLALEMMEQDEQLMQEELRALGSHLLLSGFNLYDLDQYWDMRMDIDGMSYEELLALGEKIGTVSTALSEEQLLKCVEGGKYQKTSSQVTRGREVAAEIKCSICQEEYVIGDEIGRLAGCQHWYHAACINQWLMLKNWCPICRSSAAQPLSS